MVTIEKYGRVTPAEAVTFNTALKDAEKLVKGLTAFTGIVEKQKFINQIDAAIDILTDLASFKQFIEGIRAELVAV